MEGAPSPESILSLSPEGADRLLDELERTVPVHPGFVDVPSRGFTEAIVFGDTHGDWRTSLELERAFLAERGGPRCLIGLGDFVDRHPADCGDGSVANALFLLGLAGRYPDRVYLLQGNHETTRRIPVIPQTLPEEVDDLWGPQVHRYLRILALLERGPFAGATPSGAYLAHAGFPRGPLPPDWKAAFEHPDDDRLAEIVWAECDASQARRGAAEAWGGRDLAGFLAATGLSVFLRGHDPDVNGRPLYGGRCLTLNTTRVYERYGGVVFARLPLAGRVTSVAELVVEHVATEGKRFAPVD